MTRINVVRPRKGKAAARVLAVILGVIVLASLGVTLLALQSSIPPPGQPMGQELTWRPASEIAEADRRHVDAAIDDEDSVWMDPSDLPPDTLEARDPIRSQLEYAEFPVAGGGTLLFIGGTTTSPQCPYLIQIFGRFDASGDRRLLDVDCGNTPPRSMLRLLQRPDRSMPDFINPQSDLIDYVYAWDGSKWSGFEVVESFKMDREYPDLSERMEYRVPADLVKTRLGHLAQYAGHYDAAPIFKDPSVRRYLRRGLGDRYLTLLETYNGRAPWYIEDGCLILAGHGRRNYSVYDGSLSAICFRDSTIHVAIEMNDGDDLPRVILLSPARRYEDVPRALRKDIHSSFASIDERVRRQPYQDGYGADIFRTPVGERFTWLRPPSAWTVLRESVDTLWREISADR